MKNKVPEISERTRVSAVLEREAVVTNGIPPAATIVTMTLKDIGGTIWAGAGGMAEFVPAPNIPGPYFWGGTTDFIKRAPFGTDANGFVQLDLVDNTTVTPAGSTWRFTISPNATMPAVVFNLMVAGSSMDISSIFTSQSYVLQNSLVQSMFVPRAYADPEVAVPPNEGQLYWNSTNKQLRAWASGGWHSILGGGYSTVGANTDANTLATGTYQSPTGFTNGPPTAPITNQFIATIGVVQFGYSEDQNPPVLYHRMFVRGAGWAGWVAT